LVLDPFGGSGVTAIEALILRRKAIHIDLNPLANFITREIAVSPVDLGELTEAFDRVSKACAPVLAGWRKRDDAYFEDHEVPHWYPKGVLLPKNSDARFVEELFTRRQLFVLSLILDRIKQERNRELRDLLLFCFSATLAKSNRTFISARNRAETRGGPTIFSVYRYAIPREPVELDPWEQFAARFRNLILSKRETNRLIDDFYHPSTCQIIQGSATCLTDHLDPASVDYVFTDPPYGAHIAYLDLSTMWNAWLGFDISRADREKEIISGGDLHHSRDHYIGLLRKSIEQISKALKSRGWLSLVFEHKDVTFYSSIIEAAEEAGLPHVNTVMQSLDVVWSMHKKKNPMKVLSGELILNFRKMSNRQRKPRPRAALDLVQLIQEVAREQVALQRGARTEDIFNSLMVRLMDSRQISEKPVTFQFLLDSLVSDGFRFDPDTGRWYLGDKPIGAQPSLPF
jgi:adenine-specific DNA methylase